MVYEGEGVKGSGPGSVRQPVLGVWKGVKKPWGEGEEEGNNTVQNVNMAQSPLSPFFSFTFFVSRVWVCA